MSDQMQPAPKPGLLARVGAAARLVATGKVDQTTWFGPLEPLKPVAPAEVAGRRFDYLNGRNLNNQPRGEGDSRIGFEQLRALADRCDVLRLVIETRKDQVSKLEWDIQPKKKTNKEADDPRCQEIKEFLAMPDGENSWDSWLRQLVEDMLVIDAATIYPRMTRGGGLYSLDLIDGATIKPVIDDHGRRPLPPLPAYQQVLHGMPAVDYSADQLIYLPRNRRTNKVYGFSPVEQIVLTVNMALRRQMQQLDFYTEGTVPAALAGVPDTWSPEQIEAYQGYWDSLLTDNMAERRKVRWVPESVAKAFIQLKDGVLKDEFDEWLARIVCYAFSVSPQWAVKQMNRATSDTAQEVSLEEGLAPIKIWIKFAVDLIIAKVFGCTDLEFGWGGGEEVDATEQENLLQLRLKSAVITINEYRADIGKDPIGPNGDVYLLFTAGAVVTLDSIINPPPPPPPGIGHNGGPPLDDGEGGANPSPGADAPPSPSRGEGKTPSPSEGEGRGEGAANPSSTPDKDMVKAATPTLRHLGPPDTNRQAARVARRALEVIFRGLFAQEAKSVARKSRTADRPMLKADEAGTEDSDGIAPLDPEAWDAAQKDVAGTLTTLAEDGVSTGAAAIGVSTDLANPRAVEWAENHAAGLIKDLQGTTLSALRDLVAKSESEGWSVDKLAKAIEGDSTFGADRARLIAGMETRTADYQANLIAWKSAKELGIDVRKSWIPRGENICQECLGNQADGAIPADESFSSGDDVAPAHVNCECDVEPVLAGDDATEEDS